MANVSLVLLTAALALPGPAAAAPAEPVEVTYLANEGFLIARGERKVLVDALFPGIPNYPVAGAELVADMVAGEPPFDGVDLVLVSHFHRDHFGVAEVGRFLASQPEAVFVSTPQTVEALAAAGSPPADRVRALWPEEGASVRVEIVGIGLTALNLHHVRGPRPTQNLGLLVDLDGFRVLHVGDTEVSAEEIRPLGLDSMEIDLALLPDWLLAEPAWAGVVEAIAPGALIAMHVAEPSAPASWFGAAGSRAGRVERIRGEHPGAWIATEPMAKRVFVDSAP